MEHVVIENPVINSPFVEPRRHFRFSDDGITNDIIEERRPISYFIPIPSPKKKGRQLSLLTDTEWTGDSLRSLAYQRTCLACGPPGVRAEDEPKGADSRAWESLGNREGRIPPHRQAGGWSVLRGLTAKTSSRAALPLRLGVTTLANQIKNRYISLSMKAICKMNKGLR